MSSINNIQYTSLPMLDTSFPLSPPGTPQMRGSTFTTPSSALSSTSLLDLYKMHPNTMSLTVPEANALGLQILTPPVSQHTTPLMAADPTSSVSHSGPFPFPRSDRRVFLPSDPKDTSCPRPQPRQPKYSVYLPRQGSSICPYPIPKRISSLHAPLGNSNKVQKHLTRQRSRSQQISRSSSESSISSVLSRTSNSFGTSSRILTATPMAYRAALASQAQVVEVGNAARISSAASMSTIHTNVSHESSNSGLGICDPTQPLSLDIDATSSEIYPLLSSGTSSNDSSDPLSSTTSSYDPVFSTYSQPYNFDGDFDWTTEFSLADELFAPLVSVQDLTSLCALPPTTLSNQDLFVPTTARDEAQHNTLKTSGSGDDLVGTESSKEKPMPVLSYESNFVPASEGGNGVLRDTSRLKGRVLRPWN